MVNRGQANKVLSKAQEYGATGGTIFLGEGTGQSSKLLDKLGLNKIQKEVLMIEASSEISSDLQDKLSDYFEFSKRNKGIAFSIPFLRRKFKSKKDEGTESFINSNSSYYCIVTILDKGKNKQCIKSAKAAGAKGGTLIQGHGAGVPTNFYFSLNIEPKKDIVMILTKKDNLNGIKDRIVTDLELYKEGNGILFVLPVIKMSGIVEAREVRV